MGTGAVLPENKNGRILRMSIKKEQRRQGIATALLHQLIQIGEQNHYQSILLETTSTWETAVQFYLNNGFSITHHSNGNTHFTRLR